MALFGKFKSFVRSFTELKICINMLLFPNSQIALLRFGYLLWKPEILMSKSEWNCLC